MTYPVKVKICGITNAKDAEAAVRFGADALGFVFTKSPRKVNMPTVRKITREVGPYVTRVGVFADMPPTRIMDIMYECQLDSIQLHGAEHPSVCQELGAYKLVKVFHISEDFNPSQMDRYPVDAYMLETASEVPGGSGQVWDWKRLARRKFKRPLIVTGGLNVRNVQKAIQTLRPYAVDVSSGVEQKPGVKNHSLMKRFISNAKQIS